jgi:hypothetical protein
MATTGRRERGRQAERRATPTVAAWPDFVADGWMGPTAT